MPMGGKIAIGGIILFALIIAVVGVVIVAGGGDDEASGTTTTTATTAPTTTEESTTTTEESTTTTEDDTTTTDPDTITLLPLPDDFPLPDGTEPLESNPGTPTNRTWLSTTTYAESVPHMRDTLRGDGWTVETPSGVTRRPDTMFWRIARDGDEFTLYISEFYDGRTYISLSAR